MLFNSALFLYGFLPVTLLAFWLAHQHLGARAPLWVLLTASCLFYGAWDWRYLVMLLLSVNFHLGGFAGPIEDRNPVENDRESISILRDIFYKPNQRFNIARSLCSPFDFCVARAAFFSAIYFSLSR